MDEMTAGGRTLLIADGGHTACGEDGTTVQLLRRKEKGVAGIGLYSEAADGKGYFLPLV